MFSAPAVAGDLVFIGSCNGVVHAIARKTGRGRWTYNALQDGGKRAEFHGNPVLTDELLILASDDRSPGGIGHVYAFERETGRVRWRHREDGGVMADLVRDGDRLHAVTLGDELVTLDLHTGRLRWRFASGWTNEARTSVSAAVAVVDGRVFFAGQNGMVHALDANSGRLMWKRDVGARVMTPLVATSGGVYLGTIDRRIHLLGTDPEARHASLPLAGIPGPPARIEDNVLVLVYGEKGDTAALSAVDRELKAIRWTRESPGGWSSARAYAWRGKVVVGSARGRVVAFSPDGAEAWAETVGGVVRGIGVTDDVLYVGTLSGTVYALRPPR